MTVENPTNTSIHQGNGVATQFPYTFKIPDASYVEVSLQNFNTGAITEVLTPGTFNITGLGWDNEGGGYVEYPLSGPPLSNEFNIILQRIVPYTQGLNLQNQGGFYPESVENQLDLLEMQIQQLAEQADRSLKIPIGTAGSELDTLIESILILDDSVDAIETVADNIDSVNLLAPYAQNISDNVSDINNFNDVWLGAQNSNPTTRVDGSPLQPGDLYFNTVVKLVRVFDGVDWLDAAAQALDVSTKSFVGNGVTTSFTLNVSAGSTNNLLVEVNNKLLVPQVDFTVAGTTLTITPAVANGVAINTWLISTSATLNEPADGSVTTVKIVNSAVTTPKLVDGVLSADAAGRAKMANGFVTGAKVEQNLIADFVKLLTLANNSGSPNTHIDIAAGSAKLGSLIVTNSATLTKRLNATWVAGSGNGGLDTGAVAINTTYHIYSLRKQSDGSFDAVLSTSGVSPNMTLLTGYDVIQRLGAIRTNGSGNIIPFVQVANLFRIAEVQDFASGATVAKALMTLSVPTGVHVRALLRFQATNSGSTSEVGISTSPGDNANLVVTQFYSGQSGTAPSGNKAATGTELTNTSGQIYREAGVNGGGGQTAYIHTYGWEDITIPRIG